MLRHGLGNTVIVVVLCGMVSHGWRIRLVMGVYGGGYRVTSGSACGKN
jgi:hypothetical protein